MRNSLVQWGLAIFSTYTKIDWLIRTSYCGYVLVKKLVRCTPLSVNHASGVPITLRVRYGYGYQEFGVIIHGTNQLRFVNGPKTTGWNSCGSPSSSFLLFFLLATIGCGLMNNETSTTISYTWINMTIQFCVEVCRGALLPIAAITVAKYYF